MSLADELQKLDQLHRNGSLTDTEFAQAKAALLDAPSVTDQPIAHHLTEQLEEVRYQNELARIDREWEIEKQNYLISNRYGRKHLPTKQSAILTAVIGGGFGIVWLAMAISITSDAPDHGPFNIAKSIFPLFGVFFILGAIGWGIYCYKRAEQYESAQAAYKSRRDNLTPGQFKE